MSRKFLERLVWVMGFMALALSIHLILITSGLPSWWPETEKSLIEGYPDFNEWVEYRSEDFAFRILFPIYPERKKQRHNVPPVDKDLDRRNFLSQDRYGREFMVSTMQFGLLAKLGDPTQVMRATLESLLGATANGSTGLLELGEHKGKPSMDFKRELGGSIYSGRLVLVDRRVYVAMYTDKKETYLPRLNQAFVDSLTIGGI